MKLLRSICELDQLSQPIWATVGFFDGVHFGHQELLSCLAEQAAQNNCCSLVITFANLPRAYHHPELDPKYITLPEEKVLLLQAQGINAVLLLEYGANIASQTALKFVNDIAQSCSLRGLCIGYDATLGNDRIDSRAGFEALAEAAGVEVVFAKQQQINGIPVKSSGVRTLIEMGNIKGTTLLLQHPYFILGEVVHGKGKGAELLDTPTANLVLPPEKLCPPAGVYACTCQVGDEAFPAATALMDPLMAGTTPLEDTTSSAAKVNFPEGSMLVEAHLDGFSGNLYGKKVRLYFHARLRDWIDYNSVSALQAQINTDIEQTRKVCSVYL